MSDVRKQVGPNTTRIRIAPLAEGIPGDFGAPDLPTSKSHAQRALCLARYLPGDFLIHGVPSARDVQVLRKAFSQADTAILDLEDNGTALRILSVLPAMLGGQVRLTGGPRLRQRPLAAAMEFLSRYGGKSSQGWPRVLGGAGIVLPDQLVVDARLTTQVATGVLLGAAVRLATHDHAHLVQVLEPSAPDYLFVTLEVLRWFGFEVSHWWEEGNLMVEFLSWAPPGADQEIRIPIDASSFSFFAAFLAMHGRVVQQSLSTGDPHPDWGFCDDVRRLLEAEPNSSLVFEDLQQRPDTFPCLVVLAAMRCGNTKIRGVPALRHKESDRIHAMAEALRTLGVSCSEQVDGIEVTGPVPVHSGPVHLTPPDDHRVVMALALLGTRLPKGIELSNPLAVEKSWPGYFDWLGRVSTLTALNAPSP